MANPYAAAALIGNCPAQLPSTGVMSNYLEAKITTETQKSGTGSFKASNSSQITDESPSAAYDSLDPAQGFFVTDGYFANIFQGLVQFNGSDGNHVVPSLAQSWTVASNFEQYTFNLRPNTWFSNKDPINAYIAWFSFVRGIWTNDPDGVYFSDYVSLSFNASSVGPDGNVFPCGLKAALSAAFNIPVSDENGLTAALNSMMNHFNPSNATQVAVMSYPNQAFVAENSTVFQMNLIQPYSIMLLDLPPQWGAIQDPVYIDANGGVYNNTLNSGISTGGMPGSGPYEITVIEPGNSGLTLTANPNYWAKGVSGLSQWIQPAVIPTVIMRFGLEPETEIEDFGSNAAQITAPPIAQFNQAYASYSEKAHFTFAQLFHNAGYPLCDLANGINTQVYPTNSTLFREAMVHAVNYTAIQQQLYTFNGTILGELFIPPVPPGWGPLDNPQNIPLYSYNITLAAQLLNESGWQGDFYTSPTIGPYAGQILGNPSGAILPSVDYAYVLPSTPETETLIEIIEAGFTQIGINLHPVGLTESTYEVDTTAPGTTPNIVGVGWCADWPDPIFQQFYDMATTVTHQPNWVNNATLNTLLARIPFETNATQQLLDTEQAYVIFTQLATILQMPNSAIYFWEQPYVQGVVYSPFQFAIFYNDIYYAPVSLS